MFLNLLESLSMDKSVISIIMGKELLCILVLVGMQVSAFMLVYVRLCVHGLTYFSISDCRSVSKNHL